MSVLNGLAGSSTKEAAGGHPHCRLCQELCVTPHSVKGNLTLAPPGAERLRVLSVCHGATLALRKTGVKSSGMPLHTIG